jgi:N-methylhydantoinase A/oxoprolinase/acetone carboxylase beta subunit
MEEAIKAVSSARGYDIRDFTLVAFGGGGQYAGRMALISGLLRARAPHTGRSLRSGFAHVRCEA